MLKADFERLLNYLKDKRILITTHNFVDIDGLVSCLGLKFFLNHYYPQQQISLTFSELAKSTKEFIDKYSEKFPKFEISLDSEINLSEVDVLLILDTNNLDLITLKENVDIKQTKIPYIFIDHHSKPITIEIENEESLNLIFDDVTSTAEIIFKFYQFFSLNPPPSIKFLLISGIITDSGFFRYMNDNTIIHVSKLLDESFNLQEILLILKRDNDLSVRIANIKGLQRVNIIRSNNWLIGISHVGSYEASVASLLLKIGFDIGIVYSNKKTEFKVATRARKKVCLLTGLHLGKILEELSDMYEGSGGGHDGAGSMTLKIKDEEILEKLVDKIKQILN